MDEGEAMTESNDEKRELSQWSRSLAEALQILDLEVEDQTILDLAEKTSGAVSPSAGPISAFLVGFAAGQGVTNGKASVEASVNSAIDVAERLLEDEHWGRDGWAGTAQ